MPENIILSELSSTQTFYLGPKRVLSNISWICLGNVLEKERKNRPIDLASFSVKLNENNSFSFQFQALQMIYGIHSISRVYIVS